MPKREEKPVKWFNNAKNYSPIQIDRSGEGFSFSLYAKFGLIRELPRDLVDIEKKPEYSAIAEAYYSQLIPKKG